MKTIIYISKNTSKKNFFLLVSINLILVLGYSIVLSLESPSKIIFNLWNLNEENNLPSLFSFGQWFLLSLIFFSISYNKQLTRSFKLFFFIIGFMSLFLSFDEFFLIHERFSNILKSRTDTSIRFKGGMGLWILPYLLIGISFLIFTYKIIRKIWIKFKKESKLIILGCTIFLLGAVVLEIISYQYLRGNDSPIYLFNIEVLFEESFEMLGISIIIYSALTIRRKLQNVSL